MTHTTGSAPAPTQLERDEHEAFPAAIAPPPRDAMSPRDENADGASTVRAAANAVAVDLQDRDTRCVAVARVRLRFAKQGDLRLIGHHDLLRLVERLTRRAGVRVALSQGFNPRPKITFAAALGLGIEGRREVLDIDLAEAVDPEVLRARLQLFSPAGLEWIEARSAPLGSAARCVASVFEVEVPAAAHASLQAGIGAFLGSKRVLRERRRDDRVITIDLRSLVASVALDEQGRLRFRLTHDGGAAARPEELLDTLGLGDLTASGVHLARVDLEIAQTS